MAKAIKAAAKKAAKKAADKKKAGASDISQESKARVDASVCSFEKDQSDYAQ